MMESLSALAVVPKAKAIAARRLTKTEYAELMRKHSVLEIVAYLKEHPYFRHSLAGLDSADVHREQLEQALNKDIFTSTNHSCIMSATKRVSRAFL